MCGGNNTKGPQIAGFCEETESTYSRYQGHNLFIQEFG